MTAPDLDAFERALDDPAAFEARFGERIRRAQADAERAAGVSQPSRLWMVLAPEWTAALAVACDFPTADGRAIPDVLAAMAELNLCERIHRGREPVFYVREEARGSQLSGLERRGHDPATTPAVAQAIAAAMLRQESAPLSPSVRIWAELAQYAADRGALFRACQAELRERLPQASLAAASLDPLARLRLAARLLAFVDPRLQFLASNIELRIELELRLADDRRRLKRFVRPGAALAAFDRLLDPASEGTWALHLIGEGGVGKSMLLRHLKIERTRERGGVAAGIDFDLLRPDYPEREPWLVLEQFADQLRLYGGASTHAFNRFDDLRLALRANADAAAPARSAAFRDLVVLFSEAVRALRVVTPDDPDGVAPAWVVLFFDTCEELEKFYAREVFPPNLLATFELVEELHRLLPHLRVVFAGRRPIAGGGAGWSRTQERPGWPERDYLSLHELRGLSRAEADELIARHREEHGSDLDGALVEAILARSRRNEHYNPFELDLLLAWAHDPEHRLTAEQLGETSKDPYVEFRILRRLTEDGLRDIMPVVASLERFDRATLRLALAEPTDERFDALWIALGHQEWIHPANELLLADHDLCARIRKWLQVEPARRDALQATRVRLQGELVQWTAAQPLAELTRERCLAVIRTGDPDDPALLDWWTALEARLAATDRLDPLERLTTAALETVQAPRSALAITLQATQGALHLRSSAVPAIVLWQGLLERPELERLSWLRVRTGLAGLDIDDPECLERCLRDAVDELRRTTGERRPLVLGALIAALERVAESLESTGLAPPTDAVMAAIDAAQAADPAGARAFVHGLWARFKLARGDGEGGRELFQRAADGAAGAVGRGYVEWPPPGDLAIRLAAERVRLLYPTHIAADEALELTTALYSDARRVRDEIHHGEDALDADRLLSLDTTLKAALGVARLVPLMRPLKPTTLRRNLHRNVPDLDVSVAEAAASVGDVLWAVDRLQKCRAVAESSASDQIVVRDAERALRKIILAWRLFDDDRSPPHSSLSEALADLLAIRGLDRPTAFEDGDPVAVHAGWRASVPDIQELRVAAAAFVSAAIMRVDEPLLALELKLDLQELHLLVGDPERVQLTEPLPGGDPERAYRLQLRATALLGEGASVITSTSLGRRRAATIALDEGTLLALRLPVRARQILQTARELYDAVDDSLGRLFAATQLCMVALRQGRDRRGAIAELADAYARAAKVHRLPDWNALRAVRHAALTRNPETDFWRPWLARIIACIAAGELPREQWSGAFAELTRALGRRDLPTELDMLMRAVEPVRSGPSRGPPSAGDTAAASVVAVAATPDPTSFRWTASRGRTAMVRFEPDRRVRFEGHETLLHGLLQSGRPVELRLDAGTHGVPWEELLLPSRLSVCRVNRVAREVASDHSELRSVLLWSKDRATSSMLRRAWDSASMRIRVESLDSRDGALPKLGRVNVFHLLGEPVEINGDVRLRLDGFEAHLSARQDFGALIDPAALAGRLREIRLCILQGSPILAGRRDRRARDEAGMLRRVGAELARVAPFVVVIPSLAAGAMNDVIEVLPACVRPRLSFAGISKLCGRIAELRTDLAADVCVYAPSAEALADPRSEPSARDRSGTKDEGLFAFNGLDAARGGYLLPRMTAEQVVSLAQREDPNQDARQEAIALHESKSLATFAVREEVDPKNLAEAGWAVIFAHDEDPAIREALAPLLELRKQQASRSKPRRYRELSGLVGYRPGESKAKFLARQGAFGAVDPDRMPFYVLIVGDPAKIPFEFQAQLDLQYAVGRLHFDTVDEYAAYARTVVAAERGEVRPPRRIGLFGVSNPDDQATALSEERLIQGLHEQLRGAIPPDWVLDVCAVDTARKADLARILGGSDTPAVLFTANHGAGFPSGDPRQLGHQGALVCQDWPGPRAWPGPLTRDMYFGADDLGDEARLAGLIAFHVASHGAGTPEFDPSLPDRDGSGRLAPRPFVAALPRRMLGHPRGGALAVVSHVGFAWGFSAPATSRTGHQLAVFESVLRRLLDGHPIGSALDSFGARYGELSNDLALLLEDLNGNRIIQPADIAVIWTEDRDAHGFMLLGDPAVRIPR